MSFAVGVASGRLSRRGGEDRLDRLGIANRLGVDLSLDSLVRDRVAGRLGGLELLGEAPCLLTPGGDDLETGGVGFARPGQARPALSSKATYRLRLGTRKWQRLFGVEAWVPRSTQH